MELRKEGEAAETAGASGLLPLVLLGLRPPRVTRHPSFLMPACLV